MSSACCTWPTSPSSSSRRGARDPREDFVTVPSTDVVPTPVPAHRGPFRPGDRVQLTDPKGRMHTVVLEPGKSFHTHRGALEHDAMIGLADGSVITSASGTAYLAL